jgi:hypothetical protein
MLRLTPHFSRPVYEGLPWVYIMFGLAALAGSYLLAVHHYLSLLIGLLGLVVLLGGFVVLLRRRDYRQMRSQYAEPDSLDGGDKL